MVSVDDDGSGEGTRRSFVLMVNDGIFPDTKGKMIVRAEYIDALPALEEYYAKFPRRGYIIVGYPGIGGCLHHEFHVVCLSIM